MNELSIRARPVLGTTEYYAEIFGPWYDDSNPDAHGATEAEARQKAIAELRQWKDAIDIFLLMQETIESITGGVRPVKDFKPSATIDFRDVIFGSAPADANLEKPGNLVTQAKYFVAVKLDEQSFTFGVQTWEELLQIRAWVSPCP